MGSLEKLVVVIVRVWGFKGCWGLRFRGVRFLDFGMLGFRV